MRILIADRPTDDEFAKQEGPIPLLRTLNEMMNTYAHLDVSFLKDTDRVVYEVKMDDVMLGVANEPPLGLRDREPLARLFSGYQISGAKAVQTYASNHLGAQALSVVGKIKVQASKQKKQ